MIVERHEVEWSTHLSQEGRRQMMEISRTEEHERRKIGGDLIHELLHRGPWGEAAQAGAPIAGILPREAEGGGVHGAIEVEVDCQVPQSIRR